MSQMGWDGADRGMRRSWSEALWWFVRESDSAETRERQMAAVCAFKASLAPILSTEALAEHYRACSRPRSRATTKAGAVDARLDWLQRSWDVAYALRYVELLTGEALDPTSELPYWIGEWAVG